MILIKTVISKALLLLILRLCSFYAVHIGKYINRRT
jgi:hypothetical protein